MRLFNDLPPISIIPYDGQATYYPSFMDEKETTEYFDKLKEEINWQNDELVIFGKTIITNRLVAWYGSEPFEYTYSKKTKKALLFSASLLKIKKQVEEVTGAKYNSCLLNFYHSGDEGMGWHTDDEKELVKHSSIASVSLGANRKFVFKHKLNGEKVEVVLESGSLLDMHGTIQENWLHSLPKTKKIHLPRINLTFRLFEEKII